MIKHTTIVNHDHIHTKLNTISFPLNSNASSSKNKNN